ncbi:acetyl-synthetase-like protein [Diplodia corticola]|uniref:Acetyl-synthetase-like protein n=1 Tax=Diplodia corticola TaxID=236234 RepID=A0A1J9R354_9PEZI|nr:acetyl-synthetase-like protein [Diplodia corticola]OJD35009.1 acetyl-synthetase-like protein [Diplodia corticola]
MDLNYFVCTLGQAASLDAPKSRFNDINEFIDLLACSVGDKPAVGFFEPISDQSASSGVPLKRWTITFRELRIASVIVADFIDRQLRDKSLLQPQTVGLLSPSSPTFVFVWLALIRLGHPVLLIAPQCQPPAIAHLLRSCHASILFHDPSLATLAANAASETTGNLCTIPLSSAVVPADLSSLLSTTPPPALNLHARPPPTHPRTDDVAFLFHTSGTSSGLPKPIPQTHRGAVCALPQRGQLPRPIATDATDGGGDGATFTTTPLYHGGIADCFRAWAAAAPVWLFPAHALPITAANVCACLDAAAAETEAEVEVVSNGSTDIRPEGDARKKIETNGTAATQRHRPPPPPPPPPVTYFSCVPYVLQLLEADASGAGVRALRRMALVGVGGAALPAEVGDRLVDAEGVRLVSRYGSAECGFLMSSHRAYDGDREWQYLRCGAGGGGGGEFLRFEPREGEEGLAELVVLKGWPYMAKSNRDDGSFATADLMVPHPTIPGAWKYHSRADSQLTLITGKKFDSSPLESAMAVSPLLDDVLIFGNGRPFPGALLFRSERSAAMSDEDLIGAVESLVEKLNAESQQHARIPRNMLLPMPHDPGALEKSSKGTILRGKAEEKYADLIDGSYGNLSVRDSMIPDEEVTGFIIGLIKSVVSKPGELCEDDDLFSYGVDSVACMQIRYGLNQLLPKISLELPLSVVEDCGTVKRLSTFMLKLRHGESYEESEDELELMTSLIEKYGNFDAVLQEDPTATNCAANGTDNQDVVVLTGATGALGAHILHLYRDSERTSKIYCLVRGSDAHAARERVDKALTQKRLPGLVTSEHAGNSKIVVLQSQLGEAKLGLTEETYARIAAEATIIMHIAWSVNFRMRLRSFEKDNIAGVHNLLTLAFRSPRPSPPFFAFCSSVASAANWPPSDPSSSSSIIVVPETTSPSPTAASPLGYSRSKYVAELICQNAHRHHHRQRTRARSTGNIGSSSRSSSSNSNIAVFRVGQLAGDADEGVWNAREAWPLLLSTVRRTGCLPALRDEPLAWLPVDVAARAFVEAVAAGTAAASTVATAADSDSDAATAADAGEEEEDVVVGGSGCKVYHVLNEHCEPDWMRLLEWLGKLEDFEVVEPGVWVERLEERMAAVEGEGEGQQHPALKLLGHWKNAYGEGEGEAGRATAGGAERPSPAGATSADDGRRRRRIFAMEETKKVAPVLRNVRPVDEEYFGKIWTWLCGDVKME